MPLFEYRARGHRGKLLEGTMEAGTASAVATRLQDDGLLPVDIDEIKPLKKAAINVTSIFPERVSDIDIIQFSRQMASLSKAGIPILGALHGLAQSTANPLMSRTIIDIADSLSSGRDLASAMRAHPAVFSRFYVAMIRIGETTGQLEEVFAQLVGYLERDRQTRNQIKAALRYPGFVAMAIAAAIAIMNLFVIPSFARVFEQFGSALPLETRILINTSSFMVDYWPLLLALLLLGVTAVRLTLRTRQGRMRWDRGKLGIPLAGSIIYRATLARFTRMFSMAIAAGVPLVQALTVVARAMENRYLEEKILSMRSALEHGESITRAAAKTEVFDKLVLQMMTVGEETGSIDTLLAEVASFYEDEVDQDIKRLSARIEPILTIAIAGIVLVLALGVFLPMWNLAEVAIK